MGANNTACCHQLCPYSFGSILRRKPPGKGGNISQNAFSDSYPYPERGIWPNTKKRGGGSLPPTHSQFCLLTSLLISQTRMANGKTDLLFAICLGPGPGDKILNYMGCAGTLVTVPNWVTQKFSSLPTLLKDACPQQMERR